MRALPHRRLPGHRDARRPRALRDGPLRTRRSSRPCERSPHARSLHGRRVGDRHVVAVVRPGRERRQLCWTRSMCPVMTSVRSSRTTASAPGAWPPPRRGRPSPRREEPRRA
jgi:hypothetical protein